MEALEGENIKNPKGFSVDDIEVKENQEVCPNVEEEISEKTESKDNAEEVLILDYIQMSQAIFQSQQIGDPELTVEDKRKIAEELLHKSPVNFLIKFGEFLKEEHLSFFLNKYNTYEVKHYVKNLKSLLNDHNKKVMKRNRRFEAMKRMEAEGNYFSELEMEKREPLLYHQMVGQFLTEKEKLQKNWEAEKNVIPTFSKFLLDKMERDNVNELLKCQQKEEDEDLQIFESSSEDESEEKIKKQKRWGEDWEEECIKKKVKQKQPRKLKLHICPKEKDLLFQEFKSIMQNNFLNGKDNEFNYSEVDFNPDYDSIDLRSQDEEEKYFDEETYDNSVCTDTGIEDY